MKPTFKRITWRGHKLEVTGYSNGHDAELDSIEGISPLDMYLESNDEAMGQIETLFAEACNEVDSDALYEMNHGNK
tara:strand:+ start:107 stop:334 length:228 start_codon:yes stop_codon:yes gene_type:complete